MSKRASNPAKIFGKSFLAGWIKTVAFEPKGRLCPWDGMAGRERTIRSLGRSCSCQRQAGANSTGQPWSGAYKAPVLNKIQEEKMFARPGRFGHGTCRTQGSPNK